MQERFTGVRGVLFDLFGTLVHFDTKRLPTLECSRGLSRSTVPAFADLLSEVLPGVEPARFHDALVEVSIPMIESRRRTGREIPSRERFLRAMRRCSDTRSEDRAELEEKARRLSLAHMEQLVAVTFAPAANGALLRRLGARFRLGCVSNFDHAESAVEILRRTGLEASLSAVIVSEEFGFCKPQPSIFGAALRKLGLEPSEVVFVGDTYEDDVRGARGAGLRPVWLNPRGRPAPDDESTTATVQALPEIEPLLVE